MRQAERLAGILRKIPSKEKFWIREVRNIKTVTIHTENRRHLISMNPKFVKQLSDYQIKTVLLHEIKHLEKKHSKRCEQLVMLLSQKEIVRMFRLAADLEVNQEVKCIRGQIGVGKGRFKHFQKGLNAEQYFVCVLHQELCQSTQTRKT